MTSAKIEQISKANSEAAAKTVHTVEQIAKPATEELAKTGQAAQEVVKGQIEAVTESGNSAMAGLQELVKAYQSLATKNAQRLSASMKAIVDAKTVPEFVEIQRKLATGGVEEAVNDYLHIAELTAALVTASFEPLKRQVATMHRRTLDVAAGKDDRPNAS